MDTKMNFNETKSHLLSSDLSRDEIEQLMVALWEKQDSFGRKDIKNLFKNLERFYYKETLTVDELELSTIAKYPHLFKDVKQLYFFGDVTDIHPKTINLQNIEILVIEDEIQCVPEWVFELQNLIQLDLSSACIKTLPENVCKLINLEILDLSHSNLQSLPESIGGLIKLRHLDLSHSKIREIPLSIQNLINLEELYLKFTKINSIPECIFSLPSIKRIYLEGTVIKDISKSTKIEIIY